MVPGSDGDFLVHSRRRGSRREPESRHRRDVHDAVPGGRLREGGAITERLIGSPPADAEVLCLALCAHSRYLWHVGQLDQARRFADQAIRAAPDPKAASGTLTARGISNLLAGHTAEAVEDHAEATALARELHDEPALLTSALVLEAQPLMAAQSLDAAAARLDEARTVGFTRRCERRVSPRQPPWGPGDLCGTAAGRARAIRAVAGAGDVGRHDADCVRPVRGR